MTTANLLPEGVTWTINPPDIDISLESIITKSVSVGVVTEGAVNPDYYLNTPPEVSPTEITMIGRQSLVDRVAKAQVTINLAGRVGPLTSLNPIQLLDSQNVPITDNTISYSPTQVSVSANIDYKFLTRTVPVRVVTAGDPAVGYIAGSAQASPTVVTLSSGNSELLNSINYVETEPITITNATSEVSATVKLKTPADTTVIHNND